MEIVAFFCCMCHKCMKLISLEPGFSHFTFPFPFRHRPTTHSSTYAYFDWLFSLCGKSFGPSFWALVLSGSQLSHSCHRNAFEFSMCQLERPLICVCKHVCVCVCVCACEYEVSVSVCDEPKLCYDFWPFAVYLWRTGTRPEVWQCINIFSHARSDNNASEFTINALPAGFLFVYA